MGISNELETKEGQLEHFANLLVRRDRLYQEAEFILVDYNRLFGDLIVENFRLKIECIRTKKAINYCRRRLNRGLPIDANDMKAAIEKEMYLYQCQLKEMIADVEGAKAARIIPAVQVRKCKRIYRRLVKRIHPDTHWITMQNETLKDLWLRTIKAYHNLNLEELENLEILVGKTLEMLGEESLEVDYSDLEARIERIEYQINEIITSEPYILRQFCQDETAEKLHRVVLQEEYESFSQYLESLTKVLNEILEKGDIQLLWKMD